MQSSVRQLWDSLEEPTCLEVSESMLEAPRPSRTALGVAIRRASHQLYDSRPLVLDDPIAVPILGETYRALLEEAAASIHDRFSLGMRALLVARNRYAEDKVAQATSRDVRQYVLLGAGLATFATVTRTPASTYLRSIIPLRSNGSVGSWARMDCQSP